MAVPRLTSSSTDKFYLIPATEQLHSYCGVLESAFFHTIRADMRRTDRPFV